MEREILFASMATHLLSHSFEDFRVAGNRADREELHYLHRMVEDFSNAHKRMESKTQGRRGLKRSTHLAKAK